MSLESVVEVCHETAEHFVTIAQYQQGELVARFRHEHTFQTALEAASLGKRIDDALYHERQLDLDHWGSMPLTYVPTQFMAFLHITGGHRREVFA